jgi:type II secretory pathway pseudopilin PulG
LARLLPTNLRPKGHNQGFSLIEVLAAGAIGMIGLFATLATALYAARGNAERRDVQVGAQLAEHVLATIQGEATMWTGDGNPIAILEYLGHLPTPATPGQGTAWLAGPTQAFAADKRVGPLGSDIRYDQGALLEIPSDRGTRYCVHYKLTWVSTDMVRADVRVSWPRSNAPSEAYLACPSDMLFDVANVGSVSLPGLVMRNVNVQ